MYRMKSLMRATCSSLSHFIAGFGCENSLDKIIRNHVRYEKPMGDIGNFNHFNMPVPVSLDQESCSFLTMDSSPLVFISSRRLIISPSLPAG